jgi:hypothetical protein
MFLMGANFCQSGNASDACDFPKMLRRFDAKRTRIAGVLNTLQPGCDEQYGCSGMIGPLRATVAGGG